MNIGVQADGWNYHSRGPEPIGDCRKLVTLEESGMVWIGIRAFDHQRQKWLNNGEPERAKVVAWRDLPDVARGFWLSGKLHFAPQGWPESADSCERNDIHREGKP